MAGDERDEPSDKVRAAYASYERDGRAHLWDRSNRGFARLKTEAEGRITDLILASIRDAGARLLDIGCGEGEVAEAAQLAGIKAEWTGVDLLPGHIEVARRRLPEARWMVGDASHMSLPDASFDVGVAVTLFSSVPDPSTEGSIAREIRRVLRPGGWLVWHDLRYDNPSNPSVHGVSKGRIQELFPGWDVALASFTLAPPISRRLGPLTPIAYPILHAIPPLRSHLVGRLRCPT